MICCIDYWTVWAVNSDSASGAEACSVHINQITATGGSAQRTYWAGLQFKCYTRWIADNSKAFAKNINRETISSNRDVTFRNFNKIRQIKFGQSNINVNTCGTCDECGRGGQHIAFIIANIDNIVWQSDGVKASARNSDGCMNADIDWGHLWSGVLRPLEWAGTAAFGYDIAYYNVHLFIFVQI